MESKDQKQENKQINEEEKENIMEEKEEIHEILLNLDVRHISQRK